MARAVIVFHSYYGCETGCCGHRVAVLDPVPEGEWDFLDAEQGPFQFEHPYGKDPIEFAKDLIARELGDDHVKDLDWGHCIVLED